MATTAERIKQLRKKKGISQSELAALIGVKNNTVSTWERGTRKPDFAALQLLSEYFEISLEYLLGTSDEEETRFKPSQEDLDFYALSAKADEIPNETLSVNLSYPDDEFWNYESLYHYTKDEIISKTIVKGISTYYKETI